MAAAPTRLTARGLRIVVAGAAVFATLYALFMTILAAADAEIASRGERATAIVVEVGETRRARRLWVAEVMLAVPRPGGVELLAWAARPLRVTGGWSDPARPPRRGDRAEVFVVPDTPPRIVPANAVEGRWTWLVSLGFAWLLAGGAWIATRIAWRRTATAGPPAG